MIGYSIRRFFFLGLLLLAAGSPAVASEVRSAGSGVCARSPDACVWSAADRSSLGPVVLADSWSIGKLVAGGGRTRIVQFCVVIMCIALFIMMRKLH
jgi:hypothetical protein